MGERKYLFFLVGGQENNALRTTEGLVDDNVEWLVRLGLVNDSPSNLTFIL